MTHSDKISQDSKADDVKKKPNLTVIVAFIVVLFSGIGYYSFIRPQMAIGLVRMYHTDDYGEEYGPGQWIQDVDDVHTVYGWRAQNVKGSTYFVSFEFDDDGDRYTGYRLYSYEVELGPNIVRTVSGNATLTQKYIELGYLSEE